MGCASPINKRRKNDDYPTPPWCTQRLIKVEAMYLKQLPGPIWECCEDKDKHNISRELRRAGYDVIATGLDSGGDFLQVTTRHGWLIVTNPPFSLATKFILHAHKLGVEYHAWLLKADFLNAQRAIPLIEKIGYPARIWALTDRPDFEGQGAPCMNCSWHVWDGHYDHGSIRLLSE
jgi:hypothetical protein